LTCGPLFHFAHTLIAFRGFNEAVSHSQQGGLSDLRPPTVVPKDQQRAPSLRSRAERQANAPAKFGGTTGLR
jgi:hypothetical protein